MKINLQRMIISLTELINAIEDEEIDIEPLDPLYSQLHHTRRSCMNLVDILEELELDDEQD